ncbi:MFS transporter [Arthrobacter sp. ok362]|uniref:MFS transporter n=1 Tax=Arthrobacter sp. ok362 TaxID=1761745 RepID=UPI002676FB84|nr:MFS transporter [Arthrobacter sp. ok362]
MHHGHRPPQRGGGHCPYRRKTPEQHTRPRLDRRAAASGTGFGSAWLRAESAIGPLLVGWIVDNFGISYVFTVFAAAALIGGLITIVFAIETKGRALEEHSP